jgi:hypothetical protein
LFGDPAEAVSLASELRHPRQGSRFHRVGYESATLSLPAKGRCAVRITAVRRLARPPGGQSKADHVSLVLADGTEDLANELSARIRRIIGEVALLPLGTGESLPTEPTHLCEQLFLKDEIASEAIQTGYDQAADGSCSDEVEGLCQARSVLQFLRPADAFISEPGGDLDSGRPGPSANLIVLNVESEPLLGLSIGTHSGVRNNLRTDHLIPPAQ